MGAAEALNAAHETMEVNGPEEGATQLMNEGLDNEMMEDTGVADVSSTAHESMDVIGLEEGLTQRGEGGPKAPSSRSERARPAGA